MNDKTKYCVDCKHFSAGPVAQSDGTLLPDVCLKSGKLDLVKKLPYHSTAIRERGIGAPCGIDAHWFEPKLA